MKTIIVTLIALSANFASAYVNTTEDITIISWCSQNNVIVKDKNGQNTVLANCSLNNLTCEESVKYAGRVQVGTATCTKK